jgi:hypothetical protein
MAEMCIYIAGPMTVYADFNYLAFLSALCLHDKIW